MLLSVYFTSCGGDSSDEPVSVIPTDLEVSINVSESGNGIVSVTASAVNARTYEFIFKDRAEPIQNTTGTANYVYDETGTYRLEVRAYANGTEYISEVNEISVTVEIDIANPPSSGATSPLDRSGYNLVWQDEFDSTALDLNNWTHETGNGNNGWGNSELQFYRSQNTTVSDGVLTIEAREERFGGFDYTSSRIITQNKQGFQYGRIDIRAALPFGQGIWPALWMLGDNFSQVGWPRCGEIDIMELLGQKPNEVFGTLHWANAAGDRACTCGDPGAYYSLPEGNFSDKWHVFSLEWTETSIKWFVDNQLYYSVDISAAEKDEFRNSFFFIFNIAVGGNLPGSPNPQTLFPQRMFIDYVRVFQAEN